MECSEGFRIFLFTAYLISIVSALANPADLNYELAYQLTQGANIVTLLLLAYCRRSTTQTLLASLLGVAFTLRTTGAWAGGSRWDALLVVLGMFVVMKKAFVLMLPSSVPHKTILYLAFSLFILPVLAALPHLVHGQQVDDARLTNALQLAGFQAYALPKRDDARAGVLYDAGTDTSVALTADASNDTWVYFTGSESLKDWKINIDVLSNDVPLDWGCGSDNPLRVHRGYLQAFSSVAPRLFDAVRGRMLRAGGRLILCGHSLGGALATLAGVYFACRMPEVRPYLTVVTFGAPQVGDGNFVKFFNRVVPNSVRVVNPMDPVPRVLNAQLVHVKGYTPVATFTLDAVARAHSATTYAAALRLGRTLRTVASFLPAVLAALAIGLYLAWQHDA